MNSIPPLAWAAIAIILILTLVINLSMFLMLRGRKQISARRPASRTAQNLQRATNVLRDPFAEERKQLRELSNLIGHLQETPPEHREPPPDEKK